MLVATRDPMPSPGAHDGPSRPHEAPRAARSTRFVAAMQIAGSMIAIPVGLGSAYTVYRANFSVETTCQTLRANIISMIDKQIDAATRRMLVQHDVETFERTCGGVDPGAEAAFKALLAADKAPARAAVVSPKRVEAPKAEAKAEAKAEPKIEAKTEPAKEAKEERKLELRAAIPSEPAKPKDVAREPARETPRVAAREPATEVAAPVQHDAATDTRWLEAVRGALVAHEKAAEAAPAEPASVRGTPPRPLASMPARPAAETAAPVATAPVPAAPVLPPPTQLSEPGAGGNVATAQPADPDRPVPPASIPNENGPKPTGWLTNVPFVGQVLAK